MVSSSGLHISIMTTRNLHKGGDRVPLRLSSGSVVTFKSTIFNLTERSAAQSSYLNLYNKKGDIILQITFRAGQKKIYCDDYSSFRNGWGKEQSANLDVDRLQHQEARILVYSFLTDSRINRYQILVNGTTVCYFDSRFQQPVTHMSYSQLSAATPPILSNPLEVVCCAMSDLSPEEQRAIHSER